MQTYLTTHLKHDKFLELFRFAISNTPFVAIIKPDYSFSSL